MSQSCDFDDAVSARDLAEKSLAEAHEAFDCCVESVRQTQDVLGQSADTAAAFSLEVGAKTLQCTEAHLYASFELVRLFVQAKDLQETLAIQIAFAQHHAQTCQQLAQKLLQLVAQYTLPTPRIDYDAD